MIKSLFFAVEGLRLNDFEKRLLEKHSPMGVTLFGRNVKDKTQIKALVKSIKETLQRDDVLIAIDQEGGRVRRLAEPLWRTYAPQSVLGQVDETATVYHARLIADDLKELGINVNFAPVLDMAFGDTTPALKSRCFSDDEKTTAKLGKLMIDEYVKQGICPCIKHMPGHGRAVNDPHLALPLLDFSLKELSKDFYPFKFNHKAPMGMTAHMVVPEIDEQNPITQSKKGIERLIRGEIGFEGLLAADALDMKALKGTFGQKAKKALDAGCDSVCFYTTVPAEVEDICDNCRPLEGKSLERFEQAVKATKNSSNFDVKQTAAKYAKLVDKGLSEYKEEYDATMVLEQMKKKEVNVKR